MGACIRGSENQSITANKNTAYKTVKLKPKFRLKCCTMEDISLRKKLSNDIFFMKLVSAPTLKIESNPLLNRRKMQRELVN